MVFMSFCTVFQVSGQTGLPQDQTCQESKTDPLLCSGGIFADDSSLGLAGIKWVMESLVENYLLVVLCMT